MPSPPGHVLKECIAEARRAIDDGNEDCIGLERLPKWPRCEALTPERHYKAAGHCPRTSRFRTQDGKLFCQIHAELWAAQHNGGFAND